MNAPAVKYAEETFTRLVKDGGWAGVMKSREPSAHEVLVDDLRDGSVGVLVRRGDTTAGAYRLVEGPRGFGLDPLDPACDARLPGVAMLTDGSLNDRLDNETRSCVTVAYRPGRRLVARVQLSSGANVYVKFIRPNAFRRALSVLDQLPVDGLIAFARPTVIWPEANAFATAECPGQALWQRHELHTMVHARPPLAALAALEAAALPRHDADSEREATLRLLHKASVVSPAVRDLKELVSEATFEPTTQEGFLHRDLHEKQIFVSEGRWTLIDWEGASLGDTRCDAINLEEHFRLRTLRPDSRAAGPPYDRPPHHRPPHDQIAWRGMVRARLAAVYARRPQWKWLCEQLADESRELLQAVAS